MVALRWLLMLMGAGLFGSAGALVAYDIYLSEQLRRLLSRNKTDESGVEVEHWLAALSGRCVGGWRCN